MTANVNVTKVLFKRGNTAQNAAYTGINGEITVDTQAKTLRIHDGVTAGGNIITAGGVVGSYSNTNAAAYIPTDPTITSIQANVAAANAAISVIAGIDTNLIANAATQQTQINLINANVAAANALIPNLLAVSGNILPAANVTYSLGSEQFQWKDLWVSNNTIYIGNTPIRVDGGTLLVNNAPVSGVAYGNTQVADYLLGNISTGNITAAANVMVIGTGDAKLTLDSFNQAALLQAKKTFNRSFGEGEGASFVYSNVAGTGSITATITNDLYLKTLLERLSSQFSTPTPEFTYSYSNVRVQVYDVTNANVIANVTGVDNYGNPDEYTLLIDQPPTPDPFSVLALDISYDYLNTVGVDVDKDLFGITTDNDDIDIKSGRDIDLQARDDFFVTAGSQFTMTLNANDGQSSTDGIILATQANGTTRSWVYRFDGATEFASGLTAEPLSNYVPVSGTKIIQSANEILELVSTGNSGQTTVGWTEVPNGTANIAAIGFNALVAGGVNITAGNLNFATASTWQFDKTGNLTLPNGTLIRDTGSVGISGIGLGNHGFNIDFGSAVNDWAIMSGANLIQVQPDTAFNISFPEVAQWQFNIDGNLTFPDGTKQITAYTGGGGGGTYGNANVQALLASNVSLIGSSSNITLATLGAGSTTTVTQEGGNPGVSGQGTITGASSNSPGIALVQPGWTVTGNNLVGTTTVTNVSGPDGFGTYTITTDTTEVDPFWYNDVYTFTSNTPSYSNITVSSGNIINAGTYGQINFVANSSGDGYGLSTIQLVPYTAGYDSAYIIIDPTYPNHIHIRAGGEQDNSPASLILGGENSHFQIPSGANSSPYIKSNGYNWQFGTDGTLTFPTGGNLIFDNSSTSIIDGVTDINAVGTIGANVIQVLSDLTSFGASPAPRIYGFSSIATTGSAVNEGNISASGNLVTGRNAYVTGNVFAAQYNFANGVNILDTITGVTSISSVVNTSIWSDASGDYQYGTLDYSYAVNGNNGQFAIQYSFPLVYGNVDVNVGNVIASNVTTTNGIFWANGQAYSTGSGTYGNTEVAAYLLTWPNVNVNILDTTSANITTLRATNFNSANAVISGGYISALTNASVITATVTTLNSTGGNITTLRATNFGTANAVITGGYINSLANLTATTAVFTNFSTGNAVINGGYISSLTNASITTSVVTNFSTANAVITGGYASGLANVTATGNVTAGNLIGYGSNTNIVAGAYTSTFDIAGNVILPNAYVSGNTTIIGIAPGYAPNRPAFRIYGSSSNNWTTANVNFKGSDIVVDYNQGSYFDSTTGVFTAPVAGLYSITLNARIGNNNGQNQIMVLKNGQTSAGNVAVMWECDTNTGTAVHYGVSSVMKLAAGDFLTANITVGTVQFDANDSWTVTYIG